MKELIKNIWEWLSVFNGFVTLFTLGAWAIIFTVLPYYIFENGFYLEGILYSIISLLFAANSFYGAYHFIKALEDISKHGRYN